MNKIITIREKLLKVFAWLILINSFILIANFTLNVHMHIMADGSVVMHAHPWAKSQSSNKPFAEHKHSIMDFITLNSLSFLFFLATIVLFLNSPKTIHLYKQYVTFKKKILFVSTPLRAPPLY